MLTALEHDGAQTIIDGFALVELGVLVIILENLRSHSDFLGILTEFLGPRGSKEADKGLWCLHMAETFMYLQAQGFVLNAVQLNNVTLHSCGRPVLLDMGVAKGGLLQCVDLKAGLEISAPNAAPEHFQNTCTDYSKSDVWTLGLLALQLYTGTSSVHGNMVEALGGHKLRKLIEDEVEAIAC